MIKFGYKYNLEEKKKVFFIKETYYAIYRLPVLSLHNIIYSSCSNHDDNDHPSRNPEQNRPEMRPKKKPCSSKPTAKIDQTKFGRYFRVFESIMLTFGATFW